MNIGDRVVTNDGESGKIASVCEFTGWLHVHLDKDDSAAYRHIHAGPYTQHELVLQND